MSSELVVWVNVQYVHVLRFQSTTDLRGPAEKGDSSRALPRTDLRMEVSLREGVTSVCCDRQESDVLHGVPTNFRGEASTYLKLHGAIAEAECDADELLILLTNDLSRTTL